MKNLVLEKKVNGFNTEELRVGDFIVFTHHKYNKDTLAVVVEISFDTMKVVDVETKLMKTFTPQVIKEGIYLIEKPNKISIKVEEEAEDKDVVGTTKEEVKPLFMFDDFVTVAIQEPIAKHKGAPVVPYTYSQEDIMSLIQAINHQMQTKCNLGK